MSNDEENFDIAPNIEEPIYSYKVVHLHNKSKIFHLTRQVLLDSALTQDTYCFFYHILANNINEFNQMYGSFACLFGRSEYEADLYLNVEMDALEHIINYIQTDKIDGERIYSNDWRLVDQIIDLATMFGMPNLVSMLRNLHPDEDQINNTIKLIKNVGYTLLDLYKQFVDNDYDVNKYREIFDEFLEENLESIIDIFIKRSMYTDSFFINLMGLYISLFIMPIVNKLK